LGFIPILLTRFLKIWLGGPMLYPLPLLTLQCASMERMKKEWGAWQAVIYARNISNFCRHADFALMLYVHVGAPNTRTTWFCTKVAVSFSQKDFYVFFIVWHNLHISLFWVCRDHKYSCTAKKTRQIQKTNNH
jgi:hypothetical protein